jgi:hypothetical protein
MRVLILGIDALEYNLVEKWNLKYLKQAEYNKISVPIPDGFEDPATVIVWPCFITGKEPKDMGYTNTEIHKSIATDMIDKFVEVKKKLPIFVKRKFAEIYIGLSMSIRRSLNLEKRTPRRGDIKAPTIFDSKEYKSVHRHIPVYDSSFSMRMGVIEAINDKTRRSQYEKDCLREFYDRKKEVFDIMMDERWDLFMEYFHCLDSIQHVFYKNKPKILNYYLLFNSFVEELTKILPEDVILLIVSDHGQENGLHTKYGFYSCNKKLNLNKPKITDFKEIIERNFLQIT